MWEVMGLITSRGLTKILKWVLTVLLPNTLQKQPENTYALSAQQMSKFLTWIGVLVFDFWDCVLTLIHGLLCLWVTSWNLILTWVVTFVFLRLACEAKKNFHHLCMLFICCIMMYIILLCIIYTFTTLIHTFNKSKLCSWCQFLSLLRIF